MQSNPGDHAKATPPHDGQDHVPEHSLQSPGNYLSAAFGGFLVGFSELIRAGSETTNVTVLRISAVLREQFSPSLSAGWISLCLMAIFSTILCSIYRPASRKESFTLGLSVFAILAAFTPQQQIRSPLEVATHQLSFFSFISQANASRLKRGEVGDYYFEFSNQQNELHDKDGLISVYDISGRHLLISMPMNTTKVSRLRLPRGYYMLKFECGGCASLRTQLIVEKPAEASTIKLSNSRVPLSFQRLFNADIVEITDVPDHELDRIVNAYSSQQQ
jgi:hypothetical protein